MNEESPKATYTPTSRLDAESSPELLGAYGHVTAFAAPGGPCSSAAMLSSASNAMSDSLHCISSEEPSTDSRMCTTEESMGGGNPHNLCGGGSYAAPHEKMTSSTEGMISLSEDSSGRDTFAQAQVYPYDGGGIRRVSRDEREDEEEPDVFVAGRSDTVDLDDSDDQMNGMLGSYREISMDEDLIGIAAYGPAGIPNGAVGGGGGASGGIDGMPGGGSKGGLSTFVANAEDTEEEVSNLTADSSPDDEDDLMRAPHDSEDDGEIIARSRPDTLLLDTTPLSDGTTSASIDAILGGSDLTGSGNTTGGSIGCGGGGGTGHLSKRGSRKSLMSSRETSLTELPGVLSKDGEMLTFVADDLQEKIKMASPIARRSGDGSSQGGSRSSTPSLYRQPQTPQLGQVDVAALADIENHARKLAMNIDTMLENLTGTLHSISSLAVDCLDTYRDSVCKTCDAMDGNIKCMYQLMAKCEELGNVVKPVYRLAEQIKEMKRLLDLFEHAVNAGTT